MSYSIASYARVCAEANQPNPEDFYDIEEYEEAFRDYWGKFDDGEASYFDGLVDAARDDAMECD